MRFNPKVGIAIGFGGVSSSPLSLFAASEPGVWLDPSDISTLFQDAAGTTPVTAAGQSVGLALDKSRGLVLGPELRTATATVGGGWTQSGGVVTATGTNGVDNVAFTLSTPTVAGRFYEVLIPNNMPLSSFYVDFGSASGSQVGNLSSSVQRIVLTCTAPGTVVRVGRWSGSVSGTIGPISVRELPGNHATQSTSLSRPTYQVDSNGRGYLLFDGTDDSLVTGTITPGTDKVQVFAGVRKLSDAATGVVAELGSNVDTTNGAFGLLAPGSATNDIRWRSRGTNTVSATQLSVSAPATVVLVGTTSISEDRAILRNNGAQAASSTADQGTGNYLAYPVYIGRRGGTSLPFNGRIYSLICRFGSNLTADQIAQTEAWVNSKTGAY